MKYQAILAAIFLAVYISECNGAPKVYVEMHFHVSWREMCQLEKYLKENVARQIVTGKRGETLAISRLVIFNFDKNCKPTPSSDASAVLEMFVVKESGPSDESNIDVEMTKKLYKVLFYFYEQKQERYLGNLFVGKIKDITVAGKDAPEKSTAYTELERLYIGIGVACAILILIIIILVALSCYKKRNEPKEDRYTARAAYKKDDHVVRTYPSAAADNPVFEKEKGQRGNPTLTDYRQTTQF